MVTLDVSHNALCELPRSFGKLVSLAQADLSSNKLRSPLVDGLGGLKRLKVCSLSVIHDALLYLRNSNPRCHFYHPQSLDLRENVAILELPAELLRDTPLHRLEVDPHLLGGDGLLRAMDGSFEYLERRKARIDQEVAGKAKGGDISLD